MSRRRLVLPGLLVALLGTILGLWLFAPGQLDSLVTAWEDWTQNAPEPVVIGITSIVVIAIWILAMIYIAKLLWWSWKQIDETVLWLWDKLLPESAIVRFGVGIMLMVLFFLIGPLVVLQALDTFEDSEDPIEEPDEDNGDDNTSDENQTDTSGTQTTDNETVNESNATAGQNSIGLLLGPG